MMRTASLVLVLVVLGATAHAQPAANVKAESSTAAASSATVTVPAPQTPASPDAPPALDPHGYSYEPDGRRDPFVSLLRRGFDADSAKGVRPAGLTGLSAAEITVKGILASQVGLVAIVRGADNRTYIVHSGDKLLDGMVRTISPDAMVILQQVNDPLSHQKEREVRKLLRQTEEAR